MNDVIEYRTMDYYSRRLAGENRIDQAIFEAEQEFAETGETVDAEVAFSELEKKFVGLNE